MHLQRRHRVRVVSMVAVVATALVGCSDSSTRDDEPDRQETLDEAVKELVAMPGGPPGAIVVVQRGADRSVHAAGVAAVGSDAAPSVDDHMRVASVAKAFEGAAALSLVDDGVMTLDDTIGQRLPDLPEAWHKVTLRQLLDHTSGRPSYTASDAFVQALTTSPGAAPPPAGLLAWVEDKPLVFPPGSQHAYSNSDNIAVGLMIEAVTGKAYADVLAEEVFGPLELEQTSLPAGTEMPDPLLHGYALDDNGQLEDLSTVFSAGYVWASGGIVSTPGDLNDFIRGYVAGELYGDEMRAAQQDLFIPAAGSEPNGPCANSASVALFRYETACGTVYGHTGNFFGYTQFAVASPDGRQLRRSHCSAIKTARIRRQVSSPRSSDWRRRRSATPPNDPPGPVTNIARAGCASGRPRTRLRCRSGRAR
jgi:D-alanyl-D-alanine carboxypeptidase